MQKELGILCHITSLPNKYGVGDFGADCFSFLNFLHNHNISAWQILPLNNTNFANCPYGAMCSFTIDEMFVDVEDLLNNKLITNKDLNPLKTLKNTKRVDYKTVKQQKKRILNIAYKNYLLSKNCEIEKLASKNKQYFEYGYYKVLLYTFNTNDWHNIKSKFYNINSAPAKKFIKQHKKEILKHVFIQVVLKYQWQKVKDYANKLNIKIMGDMPIYLDSFSFDAFRHPEYFKLDKNLYPKVYGGVAGNGSYDPPQNWGLCIWNWKELKTQNFKPIINRLKLMLSMYSWVRIDHFPGLVEHYEINAKTNKGKYVKEGGKELFLELQKHINLQKLFIEDLGGMTDSCIQIKNKFNLTGMNILQYAFNGDEQNRHLPNNTKENSIYYLGTHDNNTFIGFLNENKDKKELIRTKFNIKSNKNKKIIITCIKEMLKSKCKTIILQAQDLLKQDERFRMNYPGQMNGCFEYRLPKNYKTKISKTLHQISWE